MRRMPTEHVAKNRRFWDADSDAYQARHGEVLTRTAMAWGPWRIPEAELNVLGDVRGKDLLELGCGAAQWSIALAGLGARPVGIDLSGRQLDHARGAIRRAGVRVPLLQASAEDLPFRDQSFDVVFCDHGAMSFADPHRTVPEAARVLRPGGLLAFAHESAFRFVCWDPDTETTGRTLHGSYFDMRSYEDETTAAFQLPYGRWLALFHRWGFRVEDLIEPRPAPEATTTYEDWDPEWCHRWPGESIWRVRKAGRPPRPRLVGVAEAARILGWDKRRVSTYVRRGSFPEPVASLAGGRVWDEWDVTEFAEAFRSRIRARREATRIDRRSPDRGYSSRTPTEEGGADVAVKFLSEEWTKAVTEALNSDDAFRSAAQGQNAKVQQIVTKPDGEVKYYFKVENGQAEVAPGEIDNPEATLSQDYDTAVALARNEINGTAAYMSGRLKLVSGDLMKLMQLQGIINTLPNAISGIDTEY